MTLDEDFPALLRRLFVEDIATLPQKKVAVALSGGVSSTSLAIAAKEAGKDVTAFSFALSGHESRDFVSARQNAGALGIGFQRVDLPLDVERLVEEVRYIVGFRMALGFKTKKAATECTWPLLHLLDAVREAGLGAAVLGLADDGHFGLVKRAMLYHRYPKSEFDAWRLDFYSDPDRAQIETVRALAKLRDIEVRTPFRRSRVIHEFLRYDWDSLNKPRQKEPLRRAFPELASLKVHAHSDLQRGDSGIADHFEELRPLFDGASPVAIYNRIAKSIAGAA